MTHTHFFRQDSMTRNTQTALIPTAEVAYALTTTVDLAIALLCLYLTRFLET
jgi:hypothetical protein